MPAFRPVDRTGGGGVCAIGAGTTLDGKSEDVASWTGIRRGTAGIASPLTLASFRQAKISPRETPCLRATSETFAPGVKLSSMIRAFSSSDQRRRRSTPFKISTGTGVYPILRTSLRSHLRRSTNTDKAVKIGCIRYWRAIFGTKRLLLVMLGLTGSPDESGKRSREKGLSRAGNARVRRGMIQLAWRFLIFQKESALAQRYRVATKDARGAIRKTMIVALARKLLIALWRMVTIGEIPRVVVRANLSANASRNREFRKPASEDCRLPISNRAGGDPLSGMARMPLRSLGPPPRNFAPMRIAASWSGSHGSAEYKHVAR